MATHAHRPAASTGRARGDDPEVDAVLGVVAHADHAWRTSGTSALSGSLLDGLPEVAPA